MPHSPGDKLGPYEIVSLLGKGGMGEVYRAHDAKLNRDVAIKVLPHALAHDADYLARFQREAQTLASLNHPNIAAIYGLEGNAIVMELVEGETLKGPLPLQEALAMAKQIAEALEAAHDKGIIHRDLKPGNVKVTPEGVVKVLDFGLAKAVSERPVTTGPDSPTLTLRATEAGLILGTAGYMSPEQAAGKQVDRRADIWAFGVVLYELLTGKRLFDGETVSHTLAHVLTANLDLDAIPAGPVRDLLRRCLDRNLRNRLAHIAEARIAIDNYSETPSAPVAKSSRLPWYLAAAFALIAVAGWAAWLSKPSAPVQTVITEITPPDGAEFTAIGSEGGSAISPDGRTLAFIASNAKGVSMLYLRPLDSLEARVLAGTEAAARPFWSPDSKSLAFVAAGKLKRIDVAGGAPFTLCDARRPRGGTWSEDGVILFADQAAPLQRLPASGGTPTPVTRREASSDGRSHYFPQFLPGGKQFIYLVRGSADLQGIYLGSLDGASATRLVASDSKAVYDPASGSLLYIQGDGTLMARKLALNPPGLGGDPSVIAENVRVSVANGFADISVSTTGTLVYGRGGSRDSLRFVWKDRTGKRIESVGDLRSMDPAFRLSPTGRHAVYTRASELWLMDLIRGASMRLTSHSNGLILSPVWASDEKKIYYSAPEGIFRKSADGTGSDELVLKRPNANRPSSVSPDGKYLLHGARGIMILPLTGDSKSKPYLNSKATQGMSAFSPDGRWVAYTSDESGRTEIYLQGFPELRGKWPVSSQRGYFPVWRADGKELFWLSTNALMAASVELQPSAVKVGKPEPLFSIPEFTSAFGVSPDGKRFLMAEPEGGARDYPLVAVQNWAARLGR